ncbi:MAG: ParB/RepB/Spo0J family partition protein [Candidatus Thiodiazotropha taylori]|nr:ParB/RepB/Spo0J family partition protein [Candidatus Thiodiazotropha taylori]
MSNQNLVSLAIEIVGISKLTKACGLASRNAIKTWEKSGRIPIDAETDYPGIIEHETNGKITRVDIWRGQIDTLKPGIVYRIPVSLLSRDQNQPRRVFDTYRLQDLALSLGKDGQETPIKFVVVDGQLIIKHGERRWRAAHIGNIETLYGVLDIQTNETPHERIFRQIADNTGEPLKPWDWVETFKQFHDGGMTDQAIADELASRGINGFSRPVIANYRRLLKLPKEIQEMIKSEFLTPSHGKEILVHAKHKVIIRNLAKVLSKMVQDGENPPPSGCMAIEIRDLYEQAFPYVDGSLNGELDDERFPYSCPFDYESECKDCKNTHISRLSNGYESMFCTKPACYLAKCEAVKEEIEGNDMDQLSAGSDNLTPPDTTTTTKSNTPEPDRKYPQDTQTIAPSLNQTGGNVSQETQNSITEALKMASIDIIDLVLVYSSLPDSALGEVKLTIQSVDKRMKFDSHEMKRVAAIHALAYLHDDDITSIRDFLGLSTDQDGRQLNDGNLELEV